jgi:hypothetical protein
MRLRNTLLHFLRDHSLESTNIKRRFSFMSLVIVIILSVILVIYTLASHAQTSSILSSTCTRLPLSATNTKANGYTSPYLPTYARDNDLATRWSNSGLPLWIEYSIGTSRSICYVDIAWYRGDLRIYSFTISVSTDGVNYKNVFSGQSSGTTSGFERYNFPDTYAKYVRITITGNSENNYASIKEFNLSTNCIQFKPSSVYASGNDGNVPQNTIDNNLATRWSNSGLPS